jgi:nucleoside-diphosphate-sugar epimerase
MNVLITGSSGFLGRKVDNLLLRSFEVQRILRRPTGIGNELAIDLSDMEQVKQAISKGMFIKPDAIIHLASVTVTPETAQDINVLHTNINIAASAATICRELGCRKLINVSSMAVYPQADGDFTENALPDPSQNADCLYGLSKLNGEIIINNLLKNSQALISHLRLAIVYGEGMGESRIIPIMEKELREKNTITVFGDGERLLNLIEVNKAAEIIVRFVESDHPGIYNVGDELISTGDLAVRISENRADLVKKVAGGNRSKFRLNISRLKNTFET